MTWTNRVAWQEGMFLRAQHFQQQDRHLDQLVRARTAMLRPYPWGVAELRIDRDLLATGRFAIAAAAGVFEDGTPFVIPGEADHPPPLELPPNARNVLVHLAIPVRQSGAVEIAPPDAPDGRYAMRDFEAYDTHSASPQPAELQVGRLRLRYMLDTDDRAGWVTIGVARVTEVMSDRRVTLDEGWLPPALVCSAVPQLAGFIAELSGLLNQRGEAIAGRLAEPSERGVADVSDFLLLTAVNRWQKLLNHWAGAGNIHPEDFYAALVQMAGEFATFSATSRRPNTYPHYRHEDLQRSFAPVIADVRQYLLRFGAPTAVPIPLEDRPYNFKLGLISDRSILRSQFVMTVKADVRDNVVRTQFPRHVAIGAAEQITKLVNSQLPGIDIRPLDAAPRQLPFYPGAVYFELDRNSPHWQHMQNAAGFGIHVAGDFPNLQLELWAIRG